MKKKLFAEDEQRRHSSEWLNNSSRFFNKKEQGEPVIREYVVDDIDRRLNAEFSFKTLLCHPLWQLIDNAQPSTQSIKEVLVNLPASYVNLLYREDADGNPAGRKKINGYKLIDRTDIHALTCWIAFCLESTEPKKTVLDTPQLLALQYLLKIGLTTPFASIIVEFYNYLNQQFGYLYANQVMPSAHYAHVFHMPDGNLGYLPMRLISAGPLGIEPVLSFYQELCRRATQLKLVPDTKEGQLCFYNFIRHTEIQKLIDSLFLADNHPTSLKELKRRISIFGQH
ncbi:hypothetical protein [Shewanella sp. CG12_big_fil_rev_8_21_14_0_65_47_15]|uniref:hypothetical protein n=1 Tax=Shewanella sp. CG12_big_fil_rev_8_21_14_0_65_47_15 TaxID=1975537 RepID=UPI000CCB3364|nr:hypothetical protein [Shewanella sp. CG12_big_fil_rev_8_21_14_0_65_47_15]PIW61536.1 MAG: hypothetical protein COW15_07750 [Shewanella sp. CG12_big_fil_rev_8_21_14_0_65_47_15]